MDSMNSFNLQQLQNEIEPILNKVLDNSTDLKNVLKKYNVQKAAKLLISLESTKLEIRSDELESKVQVTEEASRTEAIEVMCSEWCESMGRWVRCNTCPD
jgi:ATP-dependent protease HslVU (ClpYQ) ATPase subunit